MTSPTHETLTQLRKLREDLPEPNEANKDIREELLAESRKLLLSLERTDNAVERICFQIWETITCQIAADLGLFDILETRHVPCSTSELAEQTKADPVLMGRLLRCLASYGVVHEEGNGSYTTTTVSKALSTEVGKASLEGSLQFLTPGWLKMPEFHKQNGYRNPVDPLKTPFTMAYDKEGIPFWKIVSTSPQARAMGIYIGAFSQGKMDWSDIYPVEERLGKYAEADPNAVLMVDVGGGLGQQAVSLKRKFPKLPGRYIVQDLLALPTESEREPDVEYQVHDFLKEQPVKGARLYYLRYIMHDWPQKSNIEILTHLRKAMKPGYSRLIINEWVVPAQGASTIMTGQDMNMMAISAGMERTEALHREYIEGAGLKITGIYKPNDRISESVIEAEVA